MITRGGFPKARRSIGWVPAACLTLFALAGVASADGSALPPIAEPATAPGALLVPVPAAIASPSATIPISSPSASHAPSAATNSLDPAPPPPAPSAVSPAASAATGDFAPANATAAVSTTAPGSAPTAPRTLTFPAGAVTVPPLTGQSATLDPNDAAAAGFDSNTDIANYERFQNPDAYEPQPPVQQFLNEEDSVISPLGVEVREDHRKLKSGEDAAGLLITGVASGSPAAAAGLRAHSEVAKNVLEGAAVAGALVFPPAVLLAPIIASVPIGDSYDLIIAIDGWRVMNFVEFQDHLRDVQAGEIVYLSVIRDGSRLQIPVKVPANLAAATPSS